MSRTQSEFIAPKCSRLLDGMFRELFEQIINIFLPKELNHKVISSHAAIETHSIQFVLRRRCRRKDNGISRFKMHSEY